MGYGKILMVMVTLLLVILWGLQVDAAGQGKGKSSRIPAPVTQTGQTICSDANNNPMECDGTTGQDGDYQAGVPWPDPRFTDRGDGTVKDNLTGLIWLRNANCFGEKTWADALYDCNTLASGVCGLTDASQAGDWRLPNIKELQSVLDFGQYGPALALGHPFVDGIWTPGDRYWSSTTYEPHTGQAWYVEMHNGVTDAYYKTSNFDFVWPVRDPQ